MKIALITTTINIPHVLALYRKLGPHVQFFVAIDEKTPHDAINFCQYDIPDCHVHFIEDQQQWACSELLGWNNDSRRNIALLEAVRWGAEIIVSVDDDMIPVDKDFFERFEIVLSEPFDGLCLGAPGKWFDAGDFTIPQVPQRGLPAGCAGKSNISMSLNADIGVMQGIILGVPDTDAHTAIAKRPMVASASDVLRHGFVVDPKVYSVFNSQFVAFRRELAPCFAQFYKWQGRNTDIFASLIMRRVMRALDLYVYFGPPFGFHARAQRDLSKDLKAEAYGVEHVKQLVEVLDSIEFSPGLSTAAMTRVIYYALYREPWFGEECANCAMTFLDDMEKVL